MFMHQDFNFFDKADSKGVPMAKSKQTIVVFGATGTLGLYLIDYLVDHLPEDWQIVATGRNPKVEYFESAYPNKVIYRQVEISNKQSFNSLPQEDIYAVVHFAGALPAYMEGYDPYQYVNSNVLGTLNVLEYARTHKADRIMYTQTISDYDGYFDEMVELQDDMPRRLPMSGDHSVYAISKCAAEDLCWNYQAEYDISCFAFRLPNIYCYMPESKTLYHDGLPAKSSYRLMIHRAQQGEPLEVWGDPNKGMDLIYVKDFCQMIYKALFAGKENSGIYNVGTGKLTSLDSLVNGIISVFSPDDSRSEKIYCPEKHDCVNYYMNVDKAQKKLGYAPAFITPELVFEDYKKEMQLNRFSKFFEERYGTSAAYEE